MAQTLVPRATPAQKIAGGSGHAFPGPVVTRGAASPASLPKNSGDAVERFFAREGGARSALPRATGPAGVRGVSATRHASAVDLSSLNVTGINRWWSYEEGDIPGVGHWMVNAHWQNLIIQSDDFDIPYRGIHLAFRRTYNSYSGHDYASDDGSTVIGQYGNGWTNTFDAHMSTNNCPNTGYSWAGYYGFSVYDVDGARYDYCFSASGLLTPPTGMQGTSLVANPDGGSFYWTKKNGTQYTFYSPYYTGANAGYSGRVYRISGRNQNNYIQFSYFWTVDASSSTYLLYSTATTDNGNLQAILRFSLFNGQRLLSEVDRPDGAAILYNYDNSGNLISVGKPAPNNSGQLVYEGYGGYHNFMWANNPRWNASNQADGGYVAFHFAAQGSSGVNGIQWVGVLNGVPPDSTGTILQPGVATGAIQYRYESVTGSGTNTAYSDTDGHQTVQYIDGGAAWGDPGRPATRMKWTGSQWLSTTETWDANNNLVSSTDARGNETDYAYDVNGNTIAVADPAATPGAVRPTSLYSYDTFNNVLAHCDQAQTDALHLDWSAAPSGDGACPASSSSSTRYTWTQTTAEPYGRLSTVTTPSTAAAPTGYTIQYSYDPTLEGGVDYGLWTRVLGTPTSDAGRTPMAHRFYDANGNVLCSNAEAGRGGVTLFAYDSLDRVTSVADADDTAAGPGTCGRAPGLSTAGVPWSTAKTTTYYPDGSVSATQTPSERALGVSTTFAYDLDGNEHTVTTHNGCLLGVSCTAGITTKWYDGADRLVEVMEPQDPTDYYTYPWLKRYYYDLTQGGTSSFRNSSLTAHGNLFKTQEYIGNSASRNPTWTATGWTDMSGTAFDALDRAVSKYSVVPSFTAEGVTTAQSSNTYDASGQAGLLSTVTNAVGDTQTLTYDGVGQVIKNVSTNSMSPTLLYSYDLNGRVVNINSAVLGDDKRAYDLAGELTSRSEPAGGGVTDPVTTSYAYFEDGKKAALTVAAESGTVPGFSATQPTKQYSYRADGKLVSEILNYNGGAYPFTWTLTPAGRPQTRSDPFASPGYQYSYDSSGRLQNLTMPNLSFANMTYDAEGEPIAFGAYGTTQTNTFSTRGELTGEAFGNDGCYPFSTSHPQGGQTVQAWHKEISANGFLLKQNVCPGSGFPTLMWDHGAGATMFGGLYAPGGQISAGQTYGYDAAGRIAGVTYNHQATVGGVTHNCVDTSARSYDTENHLVSIATAAQTGWNCANAYDLVVYTWGLNGHPISVGAVSNAASPPNANVAQRGTIHWDGDSMLF
ncbi:MAG: hypothetical protein JWM85_3630, partial [Acidimicrobiaceae bacterium]|nr:hypothetical protein [Acidimicrobiaceae bacterium]